MGILGIKHNGIMCGHTNPNPDVKKFDTKGNYNKEILKDLCVAEI